MTWRRAGAERAQPLALGADPREHVGARRERMRSPRLAEAPHQHFVGAVEEDHLGLVALLGQRVEDVGRADSGTPRSARPCRSRPASSSALHHLHQLRRELRREVVDAEVAEVLEHVQGAGPARAAHPGDDDDVHPAAHGEDCTRGRAERPSAAKEVCEVSRAGHPRDGPASGRRRGDDRARRRRDRAGRRRPTRAPGSGARGGAKSAALPTRCDRRCRARRGVATAPRRPTT